MDLLELKKKLKIVFDEKQTKDLLKKDIIEKEIGQVHAFIDYIKDAIQFELINDQKAYMIYVFEDSQKKTISNKVYLCEDGKVRYQVFQKEAYLQYNPTAVFEGAYCVVGLDKMLETIDLSDIVEFFLERLETLPKASAKIGKEIQEREEFLSFFEEQLQDNTKKR